MLDCLWRYEKYDCVICKDGRLLILDLNSNARRHPLQRAKGTLNRSLHQKQSANVNGVGIPVAVSAQRGETWELVLSVLGVMVRAHLKRRGDQQSLTGFVLYNCAVITNVYHMIYTCTYDCLIITFPTLLWNHSKQTDANTYQSLYIPNEFVISKMSCPFPRVLHRETYNWGRIDSPHPN